VTAAPASGRPVRLITRWGTLRLDDGPRLHTLVNGPGADVFLERLSALGVEYHSAMAEQEPAHADLLEAHDVLEAAARRGYRVAVQAMKEQT
jgi:glutaconate CoA-transferase subunit B